MADGLEVQTETPVTKATAKPTSEAAKAKEIASDLFDRLSARFTKLKSCTGEVKGGTWQFTLTGPKIFNGDKVVQTLACEAKFPAGVNIQKVHLALYGWCEANAPKLGVPKPGRDADE